MDEPELNPQEKKRKEKKFKKLDDEERAKLTAQEKADREVHLFRMREY